MKSTISIWLPKLALLNKEPGPTEIERLNITNKILNFTSAKNGQQILQIDGPRNHLCFNNIQKNRLN